MSPPPPRLARQLLRWFALGDRAESILGDLDEEFTDFKRKELGDSAARRWYWRLFEVSGTGVGTLGAVLTVLLSSAVLASYLPA